MPINKSVCGACGAKRFKWPLKSIGKVSVTQLAGGEGRAGCKGGATPNNFSN